MDNYTHPYIEDLRPIAERFAVEWKAAAAFRVAEQEAECDAASLRAEHIFDTDLRRAEHSRR